MKIIDFLNYNKSDIKTITISNVIGDNNFNITTIEDCILLTYPNCTVLLSYDCVLEYDDNNCIPHYIIRKNEENIGHIEIKS